MATGELIGTGVGALAGTLLFPGLGTSLGAGIGGALGGGIEGQIKSGKAKNMPLPLTDPMQLDYLNTLLRKQKALETGTAYQPQQDIITQQGAKAQSNIMKLAGGDSGSAIASTIAANRSTGRNLNELYGSMSMEGLKMMDLIGNTVNTIAKRKASIQAYEKAAALTEANDEKRKAMENLMALTTNKDFLSYLQGLTSKKTDTGGINQTVPKFDLGGIEGEVPSYDYSNIV